MSLLIVLPATLALGVWISRRSDRVWRTAAPSTRRFR